MAGKPTIPKKVHDKIRKLEASGLGRKAIAAKLGCSGYTVRKALDPDFAEAERQRHRAMWPDRAERRRDNPDYLSYRAAYFDTDAWRARARETMQAVRESRRPAG